MIFFCFVENHIKKNNYSMSNYRISLIYFFHLIFLFFSQQVFADNRIALVIGNAEYQNAPLNNPANDAFDISEALRQTGFEVDYFTNLDRKQMREAIRNFGDKLRKADTGLFYFAGHGIQIKGRNYLIPLSVDIQSADEVQDESIDAGSVLRKMESAGNAVNIVILDACRNNPFSRSFRTLDQGLARMDGPVGSFIAYATAPGSVAADGTGRNGLYTEHLLQAIRQPGLSIEQVFKQVRNGVKNATDGQQIPWESSSLMGEFVFLPSQQSDTPGLAQTIPQAVPPPIAYKYLQVISNVPDAKVIVDNVDRGLIGNQGVLNISNLTSEEAEVTVQAEGYSPLNQKIQLAEGQWKQLYVTLLPLSSAPDLATEETVGKKDSVQRGKTYCSSGKNVLLISKIVFGQDKDKKIKRSPPSVQSTIIEAFSPYNINFIEPGLIDRLNSEQDKKADFYQIANKNKLNYLLKATINVRELPIKILKTNMKTFYVDVTLELLNLKNRRRIASVSESYNKAGMDAKNVVLKILNQALPDISKNLITQACM